MADLVIMAKQTSAKYLVWVEGKTEPLACNPDTPEEVVTVETASRDLGVKVSHIEERRTYYWLPLDCYNQPVGYVEPIELFPSDFEHIHDGRVYPYYWIFEDEYQAELRALD